MEKRSVMDERVGAAARLRTAALIAACVLVMLLMQGCATSSAVTSGGGLSEIAEAVKLDLFGEEEQDCEEVEFSLPVHESFTPVSDKFAYNSLDSEELRQAYEDIEESIFLITSVSDSDGYYFTKNTRLSSALDSEDIYMVKEAVLADHPEAFWLTGSYTIGNNLHDGNYISLYSKYSCGEITERIGEINAEIEKIFQQIPSDAGELERELIVHDALVDGISYSSDASDDSESNAFGIYGALVEKSAVCTGYARSAKLLLNQLGIESRLVSGTSKDSGHMWNQVKIDGEWYNLDVTWDDPVTEEDLVYSRYNYFNITDEQIEADHEVGKDFAESFFVSVDDGQYSAAELYNFDLEECTATAANYYTLYALYVDTLDSSGSDLITAKMKEMSADKQTLLYIRFDEELSSEDVLEWLSGSSSVLGKCMVAANNSGAGSRISTCSLARLSSDDDGVWPNVYVVGLVYQ